MNSEYKRLHIVNLIPAFESDGWRIPSDQTSSKDPPVGGTPSRQNNLNHAGALDLSATPGRSRLRSDQASRRRANPHLLFAVFVNCPDLDIGDALNYTGIFEWWAQLDLNQ
jgi:hypothetical protein